MLSPDLQRKYDSLLTSLEEMQSVAVAFSAGVDSALLLAVAHEALGERAVAMTAVSPANPARETDEAIAFCEERGIRHITFEVDELQLEGFSHNPTNRCYLCKSHLFDRIATMARAEGLRYVVEGSNVDDLGDYRPGRRAIEELEIRSPMLEVGLTKQDIRDIARDLGLPQWNKPSFACLYSRFAYGAEMTLEKLRTVDAAEQYLRDEGFSIVRVRMVDDEARIEVAPADIERLAQSEVRESVVSAFKQWGFTYITLDLQGYRTGSMNAGVQTS